VTPPDDNTTADAGGDVPIEAAPGTPDTGGLSLSEDPAGGARVTITSLLGGRKEWDGKTPLSLTNLPAGSYRTKIQVPGRTSYLATVKVVTGKTCTYRLDLKSTKEDWVEAGCQ